MQISSFFATIANNFRDHYLRLAGYENEQAAPLPEKPAVEPEAAPPVEPTDRYEPSPDAIPVVNDGDKPVETDVPSGSADPEDPAVSPLQQNPDGTYYSRQARLDYKLDLAFDLGMVMRTVESLADGDTTALEEFAAAGFGFRADFDIKGKQTVETGLAEAADESNRHQLTKGMASSRDLGRFRAQSRNLQVESFYRQTAGVRRMLDIKDHDGYRRTVNKFAFRLQVDNRFSFSFAERFNVQTERIAADRPDQVGDYLDNAGELALNGSSEMMASFLTAVDGYLDHTESNLQESVLAAFDAAAAELGFSDEAGAVTRQNLASSIDGFFDRVREALAGIKSEFGLLPATVDGQGSEIPSEAPMIDQKAAVLAEA